MLLGQAPGPGKNRRAFDGASGRRLAKMLGLGLGELLSAVEPVNLIGRFPGGRASGKGDAFPMDQARRAAKRLRPRLRGRLVLMAGRAVARAFGVRAEFFELVDTGLGFDAVVVPHPSGVSHWWNRKENRRRAKRAFRKLLSS